MLTYLYNAFPTMDFANGYRLDPNSIETQVDFELEQLVKAEQDPVIRGMLLALEALFINMTLDEYHWNDISYMFEQISDRINRYRDER